MPYNIVLTASELTITLNAIEESIRNPDCTFDDSDIAIMKRVQTKLETAEKIK